MEEPSLTSAFLTLLTVCWKQLTSFSATQLLLGLLVIRILTKIPCTKKTTKKFLGWLEWCLDSTTLAVALLTVLPPVLPSITAYISAAPSVFPTFELPEIPSIVWCIASLVLLHLCLITFVGNHFHMATATGSPSDSDRDDTTTQPEVFVTGESTTDDLTAKTLTKPTSMAFESTNAIVKELRDLLQRKSQVQESVNAKLFREVKTIADQVKTIMLTTPSVNMITTCVTEAVDIALEDQGRCRPENGSMVTAPVEPTGLTDKCNPITKTVSFPRRESVDSHCYEYLDNLIPFDSDLPQVCAIMSWAKTQRPKPRAPVAHTNLTQEDRLQLETFATVEEMQAFINTKTRPQRVKRYLTDEEKKLTFDELDNKWRQEEFERRQRFNQSNLGTPTSEQYNLSVPELKRILSQKKTAAFFLRKQAEGHKVNQCEVCEEWYIGDTGVHKCVATAWKLIDRDTPRSEQFIWSQHGTGDVKIRRKSGVDDELIEQGRKKLDEYERKKQQAYNATRANMPIAERPDPLASFSSSLIKQEPVQPLLPQQQVETIDLTLEDDDGDNQMAGSVGVLKISGSPSTTSRRNF
jgi:hypothetical protein